MHSSLLPAYLKVNNNRTMITDSQEHMIRFRHIKPLEDATWKSLVEGQINPDEAQQSFAAIDAIQREVMSCVEIDNNQ